MIHSPKFGVVLDACVLYPAPIRDLLLSLAAEGLFKPKWSEKIQEEWVRNLLANRKDLKSNQLRQTINAMNRAFPDANIENYEDLITGLSLPDKDDRHVLACAIKSGVDSIMTFNLKDFPKSEVRKYDIEVQSPDEMVSILIGLSPKISCYAFSKMVERLKKPPKTKMEVGDMLEKCGLPISAAKLKNNC
jgi:predicted nucleic acid-binding protein